MLVKTAPEPEQESDTKLPPAPLSLMVTLPVGVIGLPGLVSVTVTVHVAMTPTGVQLTLVEVALTVDVTSKLPSLPIWSVSPE